MRKFILACFLFFPFFTCGQPKPWQFGFQESATPVMYYISDFHNIILVVIFSVLAIVFILIIYVLTKFNNSKNKNPSKNSHNVKLEIIWTAIPVFIVLCIAIPSLKVLRYEEHIPEADMTLKVIGRQWYWTYEYPDHDNILFDSNIKYDLEPGEPRLLTVDNEVFVPVNTNIRVQVTSSDVIHSWAIPALGVKKDAIPGRLNETWFNIKKEGIYYGQCSELCGILHGFMPIAIRAVSQEEFKNWIEQNKNKS